jgi:hypothetical protein
MRDSHQSFLFGSLLLLAVLLAAGSTGLAQVSVMSGTVMDPAGAVVPGADVTINDQATGTQRMTVTDGEGRFRFPQLRPGLYTVVVELPGFKTFRNQDVRVLVDTPLILDVRLELGEVTEVVTVSGTALRLMNQTDGSLGVAMATDQILDLPLNQRNVYQLLSLQPGVTAEGEVAGARGDQSNLTLDGIDVNEQQTGAAFQSVLRVTPDSVQEFRVTTSSPGAGQGRSSGGQVSLITKSGTNDWHGSAYNFHRNTVTAANDFFNNRSGVDRPNLIRNLYGGSVGGPIVRDKAFVFFNYEGRKDRSQDSALRTVPLAHLGQGVMFYNNAAGERISIGPDEFAALYPATGGVNPAAAAALGAAAARYPANDTGLGDGFNTGGFRFNSSTPLDWNTFIAKVDFNLTDTQSLYVRGNYQWDHEGQMPWWPDTPAPTFWNHPAGVGVGHTWMVKPTLVNTFRYGVTRQAFSNQGDSAENVISFRFYFQPRAFTRTLSRTTPLHNITNDTSWIRGNHTFQFGTNIRLIDNNRESFANSYDSAIMNNSFYAGSGASLDDPVRGTDLMYGAGQQDIFRGGVTNLLGRYTQYSGNYNFAADGSIMQSGVPNQRTFATEEYEFYFEDTWQATRDLTLNLGLRWGVNTPVYETSGFQVQPTVGLGDYFALRKNSALQGVPYNEPIIVDRAGPFYGTQGFYEQQWGNFSPRMSFAYSPSFETPLLRSLFGESGKSVIRGGFAVMYDRVGSALAVNFDLNNTLGFASTETIPANTYNVTTSIGPLFQSFNDNVRALPNLNIPDSLVFPLQKPMDGARRIESSLDNTIITPINYNWNMSIGRELKGGLYLEVSYLGRKANNLLAQRDVMHLNNLRDPASGIDWYTAAAALYSHRTGFDPATKTFGAPTPIEQVPDIPFFENLFPDVPSNWWWSWDPDLSATQNIFAFVARDGWDILDWTFLQDELDAEGVRPGMFFQPQYAALTTWSTVARSNYNAMTVTLRERMKDLTFDVNYTWSKSMDIASGRQNEGQYSYAAILVNPLFPDDSYSVSDFDITHMVNSNWLWKLPFGHGQRWGSDVPGAADAILGGWSLGGVFRWNSGLPQISPIEGSRWSTNWNLQSYLVRTRDPNVKPSKGGDHPNYWADQTFAYQSYRDPMAGETGDRNVLRNLSFFAIDFGLHKTFRMPFHEDHQLTFRWEVFNATNTQRLGAPTFGRSTFGATPDPQIGTPAPNFGNIDAIQGIPRVMQFGLRYQF